MNWTGYFKELTEYYAGDEWQVFDNVDPARVWDGKPTIEFARRGCETTPYLSGDYSESTQLSLFTRAATEIKADEAARAVYARVVTVALDALLKTDKISGYRVDRMAGFADERGARIGESFSGVVDFTIFEEVLNYG